MSESSQWTAAKLEDLFVHVIGGDWGKDEDYEDAQFLLVACIRGSEFKHWKRDLGSTSVIRKVKPSSLMGRKLQEGDILIEISGGGPEQPVGRTVLITEKVLNQFSLPVVCTNFLRLARPSSSISSAFLNYYLQFFYFSGEVVNYQGGSNNLRNLKYKEYSSISIPVPSLTEQKVIADKLDTLLAQVESIKARLERIPEILKQFRQSVLAAAVSGKLTEEWRKLNDEGGFSETTWEGILRDKKNSFKRGPFGSALKKSMFVESGFKVYEQYCPINDDCTYARYYITPEKFEEMKAFEVLDGDFLISCSGVSLGRITQVPFGSERGIINQALLRVRLNNQLYNDDFFKLVFRSPSFQKDLFENSTGSAIPNLKGVKELKAMVIPLPSLNEQEKIVELVNHHFEAISGIDECVRSALDRVNSLTQSILAKAFRGELTADWREANPELISGENSAEALLKRIKAERESAKPATKRGRGKA